MIGLERGSDLLHRAMVETPLGRHALAASDRGLRSLVPLGVPVAADDRDALHAWGARRHGGASGGGVAEALPGVSPHLTAAAEALRAYSAGDPSPFAGALDLAGTDFQIRVWRRLLAIPFGAQATYGGLAADLGVPGEARAVGAAVAANPIAILVPCHRVVGANGTLRGYAWGLDLKRRLLGHETGHVPALGRSTGA